MNCNIRFDNPNDYTRRGFLRRVGGVALAAAVSGEAFAIDAKRSKPRVLFFPRPGAYEPPIVHRNAGKPSACERIMGEIARRMNVDVECSRDGRVFDGDLERFDAFLLFCNADPMKPNKSGDPPLTARGKQRLLEAVAAGKGFVGVHCAAYSFLSGPKEEVQPIERRDPYTKMLGGELWDCLALQTCRYRVVSPDFPGVGNLKSTAFTMHDEPYALKNYADDIHVIVAHETAGLKGRAFQRPPFPCVWARRHGHGRVFYASLGHGEETWRTETFQNILSGGLDWALARVDADLTPNLSAFNPAIHCPTN